jgi:hypothetical protein
VRFGSVRQEDAVSRRSRSARPDIDLFNVFTLLTAPSQITELHVQGETVGDAVGHRAGRTGCRVHG